MLKTNYLIINRKPHAFSTMRIAGKTAVFLDENGRPVDFGVVPLEDSFYTMMSCDEAKLLMMVTDRHGVHDVIGILWKDPEEYTACCPKLSGISGTRICRRDLKISSYAWSIAEKLDDGVKIRVTDAVDESEMTGCPECGMMNPKGTPYCLECGSELE